MTVFTFTNPKGGSSKSTSAVLLATTLANFGQRVAIIDSDRNEPVMKWARRRNDPNLTVITAYDKEVMRQIEALKATHDYVIVDTEGTAHNTIGYALARTDLAILPISMSQLDVDQAGRALDFIEAQSEAFNRKIPYRLLFTKTNPGIQTKLERAIRKDATEDKVVYFETSLFVRQAFIEIFYRGATLWELRGTDVSGVERAIENAVAYAQEVVAVANAILRGESSVDAWKAGHAALPPRSNEEAA